MGTKACVDFLCELFVFFHLYNSPIVLGRCSVRLQSDPESSMSTARSERTEFQTSEKAERLRKLQIALRRHLLFFHLLYLLACLNFGSIGSYGPHWSRCGTDRVWFGSVSFGSVAASSVHVQIVAKYSWNFCSWLSNNSSWAHPKKKLSVQTKSTFLANKLHFLFVFKLKLPRNNYLDTTNATSLI